MNNVGYGDGDWDDNDNELDTYVIPLVVMVRTQGVDRHDAVNRATQEISHVFNMASDMEHPDGTLHVPVTRPADDNSADSADKRVRALPRGYQGAFDVCTITTIERAFGSGHIRAETTDRGFRGY